MDEYNEYQSNIDYDIVSFNDNNPTIKSPSSQFDLPFYQTKQSLMDPELYRQFLKNAESAFRRSAEYKAYKSYLMGLGLDHCQVMGNIEASDQVDIELHHNILNLFDICILICEHVLNTIGHISTFDLVQLLILEHYQNRVGCTLLSTTAHEMYTNDPEAYIPPEMTFGKWWELLAKYRYGITYDIAKKINTYIDRYRHQLPVSINIQHQEQILNFAHYNEYGANVSELGIEPYVNAQNASQEAIETNNIFYLDGG